MYAFLNRYTRAQLGLYRVYPFGYPSPNMRYAKKFRQSLPTAPIQVLSCTRTLSLWGVLPHLNNLAHMSKNKPFAVPLISRLSMQRTQSTAYKSPSNVAHSKYSPQRETKVFRRCANFAICYRLGPASTNLLFRFRLILTLHLVRNLKLWIKASKRTHSAPH